MDKEYDVIANYNTRSVVINAAYSDVIATIRKHDLSPAETLLMLEGVRATVLSSVFRAVPPQIQPQPELPKPNGSDRHYI